MQLCLARALICCAVSKQVGLQRAVAVNDVLNRRQRLRAGSRSQIVMNVEPVAVQIFDRELT